MKKTIILLFSILMVSFSVQSAAFAAVSQSPWGSQQKESGQGGGMDSVVGGLTSDVNGLAPMVSTIISSIFVIMFLVGVIKLGYSLVTKTGMVLKGSTGMLIGIPIFIVAIRLFFILAFTTNSSGVTLLVTDTMNALIKIGFLASVVMVLVGLVMTLFNKFLNHPAYVRWSKVLYIGAITVSVLTGIMPAVIRSI
ncbi:hypothetical protein [Ferdinandcohnia sp. SAFN-114]|uniref:hypothetical protein n=1 Tax=Ferdinandcohnia sp. SAFN-114 TaxID=3387275 RepID=UPI003F806B72